MTNIPNDTCADPSSTTLHARVAETHSCALLLGCVFYFTIVSDHVRIRFRFRVWEREGRLASLPYPYGNVFW